MSKSTKVVIKTKVTPALLAQIDGLEQAKNQSISQLMLAALINILIWQIMRLLPLIYCQFFKMN